MGYRWGVQTSADRAMSIFAGCGAIVKQQTRHSPSTIRSNSSYLYCNELRITRILYRTLPSVSSLTTVVASEQYESVVFLCIGRRLHSHHLNPRGRRRLHVHDTPKMRTAIHVVPPLSRVTEHGPIGSTDQRFVAQWLSRARCVDVIARSKRGPSLVHKKDERQQQEQQQCHRRLIQTHSGPYTFNIEEDIATAAAAFMARSAFYVSNGNNAHTPSRVMAAMLPVSSRAVEVTPSLSSPRFRRLERNVIFRTITVLHRRFVATIHYRPKHRLRPDAHHAVRNKLRALSKHFLCDKLRTASLEGCRGVTSV